MVEILKENTKKVRCLLVGVLVGFQERNLRLLGAEFLHHLRLVA